MHLSTIWAEVVIIHWGRVQDFRLCHGLGQLNIGAAVWLCNRSWLTTVTYWDSQIPNWFHMNRSQD